MACGIERFCRFRWFHHRLISFGPPARDCRWEASAFQPTPMCQPTYPGLPITPARCARTSSCMCPHIEPYVSTNPPRYAHKPSPVCPQTHPGVPANPARCVHKPSPVCPQTQPGVPTNPARCVHKPTPVCPHTKPGFAKSDLGFGNSEVGAPMIQDRIVFAPPHTKAWCPGRTREVFMGHAADFVSSNGRIGFNSAVLILLSLKTLNPKPSSLPG